jgi:hypothetical protein
MIGLEYRPTFYINIYNRIRNLSYDPEELPLSEKYLQRFTRQLSIINSEMLDTVYQDNLSHRSSEYSLTDYIECEIENKTTGIQYNLLQKPSFNDLMSNKVINKKFEELRE